MAPFVDLGILGLSLNWFFTLIAFDKKGMQSHADCNESFIFCNYVKKRVKLYIKQTMDTAFGYISIDILDIHYHLNIYIVIWR